jgi:hypothetical protein
MTAVTRTFVKIKIENITIKS